MLSSQLAETKYAPLRSLDDFILGSARFQLPNFSDLEKWGNRVVKNLLYYQTNYFCIFGLIWILFAILYPKQTFTSVILLIAILGIIRYSLQNYGTTNQGRQNYPIIFYIAIPCIIIFYLLEILPFILLVILLPFSTVFVHSSLRLRNIKNKVVNTVENLGIRNTPMGIILSAMELIPDGILS